MIEGQLHYNAFILSRDGTYVVFHAGPYSRKTTQTQNLINHSSISSITPIRSRIGDRKHWYFERSHYLLSFRNMNCTSAKIHDSISFPHAIDVFATYEFNISLTNPCLDSVHDNLPAYKLLEHRNLNALIDIKQQKKHIECSPEGYCPG